jgi:hypothetical protein
VWSGLTRVCGEPPPRVSETAANRLLRPLMGFPIGVDGKVDRPRRLGKPKAALFFATSESDFANRSPARYRQAISPDNAAAATPGTRHNWSGSEREKPRGSRGRSLSPLGALIHSAGKAGPQPGGDPRKPKPPLPRSRVSSRSVAPKLRLTVSGRQARFLLSFRVLDRVFAAALWSPCDHGSCCGRALGVAPRICHTPFL